jgi:hypothetical protein
MGGLISAMAWFEVGISMAVVRLLIDGAHPAAVSVDVLAGPLVVGWIGLAVLASATHLVPAIGPGDPHEHARQRQRLGRLAWPRLLAANTGVAALTYALTIASGAMPTVALVLLAGTLGVTATLLVSAVLSGIRNARSAGS